MAGPNGHRVFPMGQARVMGSGAFVDAPGGVKAGWMKGSFKPFQLESGEVVMREKKRRRMNVLNPRANARAARRLAGLVRTMKKTNRVLKKIGSL